MEVREALKTIDFIRVMKPKTTLCLALLLSGSLNETVGIPGKTILCDE